YGFQEDLLIIEKSDIGRYEYKALIKKPNSKYYIEIYNIYDGRYEINEKEDKNEKFNISLKERELIEYDCKKCPNLSFISLFSVCRANHFIDTRSGIIRKK
ncbi:MAG: hypothetical protein ACI94Y_004574, partial [Maribacter sp.]